MSVANVNPSDDVLLEHYRRDGFVAVRGLLSTSEIDGFRAAVDEAVARRTRNDTRAFYEKTPYGQSFLQCLFLWEDSPAVRPLNFHPKIAGTAARLLGAERVRLWHDQALYKEPGGLETEAHQDYAYWPVAEPDMLTAWIPLVDVDETNGCMGYVPGTQHAQREFVDIFATPGAGRAYAAKFGKPQFIPARRGDVIFHAARTVHMAMPNRSSATRAIHTVVYFRDGCTRAVTDNDIAPDRNGTRPGAIIDGPATPIAWPLPDGRFPDPPPRAPDNEVQRQFAKIGVLPDPTRGQSEFMTISESTPVEAAAELSLAPAGTGGVAIPVETKLLFAFGDTIDGFSTTATATFHLFYLTAVCGLSGSLAGISLFISLWFDAFIDPMIGSLSDNWRSRLGRRHPFLFASIVPLALALGLTFSVPRSLSGVGLFAYATAVALTLRISYSAFVLPFLAMGAELSSDYVERSRLIVYRVLLNTGANLLCTWLGYRVFMTGNAGLLDRAAYTPFGWTVAALMLVCGLVCAWGTLDQRERLHEPTPGGGNAARRFLFEIAEIFKSRSFVVLFITVLLFWAAQGTAGVLALHAGKFFWKLPNEMIQYIAVATAAGGLAGIPTAGVIARFVEKRSVVAGTLIVNCAQQGVLPLMRIWHLLPPNGPALYAILLALAFLLGLSGAISGIFFQSMMADATDEHELLFGSRREGLYFAGITLSAKAAIAIGALIGGFALDAIGFPRDLSRNMNAALHLPTASVDALGIVSGPLPAIISVVTLVLLLAYKIDRAATERIAVELAARRGLPRDPS